MKQTNSTRGRSNRARRRGLRRRTHNQLAAVIITLLTATISLRHPSMTRSQSGAKMEHSGLVFRTSQRLQDPLIKEHTLMDLIYSRNP